MKLLSILSFALILLQSCADVGDAFGRQYILENSTSHQIKIEFYQLGEFKYSESIAGPGIISEGFVKEEHGHAANAVGAFQADSVIVTYNNEKRQIYTRIVYANRVNISPGKRNILVDSAYVPESNELYRFTFTEEDYQNAEEL